MSSSSTLLLAVLGVAACSQGAEPSANPANTEPSQLDRISRDSVEYSEIHAGEVSLREIGLCELVEGYDAGAGLYRVGKIVGVSEASGPATYVELELLEAWSANAPGSPTVRVDGGPSADFKATTASSIDARKGEEIGALLAAPTPVSNNFYRLFAHGVFHDVGAGFTNGQLFSQAPVSAAALGAFIGAAIAKAGREDCPDQRPEHPPMPDAPEGDIQIVGPEIEGQ